MRGFFNTIAQMVELVVTLVLGTSAERRESSSLSLGTKNLVGSIRD